MLGYSNASHTIQSRFGTVPDTFAMDDVKCTGNETSILDCSHLTEDNCEVTEGAGAICVDETACSKTGVLPVNTSQHV